MERRVFWARRRTRQFIREHLVGNVIGAAVLLAAAEVAFLYHHTHGTHSVVSGALFGLLLTIGGSLALVGLYFGGCLLVARTQIELERLRPGPVAVEAENERLRRLREAVSIVQSDVRSIADQLQRLEAARVYWDIGREQFRMRRSGRSAVLLSGDPVTRPAFQAVDALNREMHRVTLIATNRWNEDLASEMLDHTFILHRPAIAPGDNLATLAAAIRTADIELTRSLERLERHP